MLKIKCDVCFKESEYFQLIEPDGWCKASVKATYYHMKTWNLCPECGKKVNYDKARKEFATEEETAPLAELLRKFILDTVQETQF